MTRVPMLWWDFRHRGKQVHSIIVESIDVRYPILAEFVITSKYADKEIEQAEKLIADLNAGRITFKKALAQYKEK